MKKVVLFTWLLAVATAWKDIGHSHVQTKEYRGVGVWPEVLSQSMNVNDDGDESTKHVSIMTNWRDGSIEAGQGSSEDVNRDYNLIYEINKNTHVNQQPSISTGSENYRYIKDLQYHGNVQDGFNRLLTRRVMNDYRNIPLTHNPREKTIMKQWVGSKRYRVPQTNEEMRRQVFTDGTGIFRYNYGVARNEHPSINEHVNNKLWSETNQNNIKELLNKWVRTNDGHDIDDAITNFGKIYRPIDTVPHDTSIGIGLRKTGFNRINELETHEHENHSVREALERPVNQIKNGERHKIGSNEDTYYYNKKRRETLSFIVQNINLYQITFKELQKAGAHFVNIRCDSDRLLQYLLRFTNYKDKNAIWNKIQQINAQLIKIENTEHNVNTRKNVKNQEINDMLVEFLTILDKVKHDSGRQTPTNPIVTSWSQRHSGNDEPFGFQVTPGKMKQEAIDERLVTETKPIIIRRNEHEEPSIRGHEGFATPNTPIKKKLKARGSIRRNLNLESIGACDDCVESYPHIKDLVINNGININKISDVGYELLKKHEKDLFEAQSLANQVKLLNSHNLLTVQLKEKLASLLYSVNQRWDMLNQLVRQVLTQSVSTCSSNIRNLFGRGGIVNYPNHRIVPKRGKTYVKYTRCRRGAVLMSPCEKCHCIHNGVAICRHLRCRPKY